MANKKDKLPKVETEPTSGEQEQAEKPVRKRTSPKAAKTGRASSPKDDELDDDDIEQITPEQARQEMMAAIRKLKGTPKS